MINYNVVILENVFKKIDDIDTYCYENFSIMGFGSKILNEIEYFQNSMSDGVVSHHQTYTKNIYIYLLNHVHYVIFYSIDSNTLIIEDIKHTKENY